MAEKGLPGSLTLKTTMEISALGRPLHLGTLYDCRSDTTIPGITLWDRETLERNVTTEEQYKTDFDIITSDSIDEKMNAMNITAELKASVLGGMVAIGGSAKYLNDTKTSQKQARVTLKYSVTTQFFHLTMNHLGYQNISYHDVFDNGTATHVVTAVLYGAQAFFVFDQKVSTNENVKDIEGLLKAEVKKILQVSGKTMYRFRVSAVYDGGWTSESSDKSDPVRTLSTIEEATVSDPDNSGGDSEEAELRIVLVGKTGTA